MKNLIFLIIVSCILCSCPDIGESTEYFYSIKNSSGKSVKLIPYVDGIPEFQNAINLNEGEVFSKKLTYSVQGPPGSKMTDLFNKSSSGIITKIEVIFANQKKTLYEGCTDINNCNGQPRNIFNVVFNDDVTETYTITPEDFQNATDCGGNCY